jgi:hypothetical protein
LNISNPYTLERDAEQRARGIGDRLGKRRRIDGHALAQYEADVVQRPAAATRASM